MRWPSNAGTLGNKGNGGACSVAGALRSAFPIGSMRSRFVIGLFPVCCCDGTCQYWWRRRLGQTC
jgi:hypothetical protein